VPTTWRGKGKKKEGLSRSKAPGRVRKRTPSSRRGHRVLVSTPGKKARQGKGEKDPHLINTTGHVKRGRARRHVKGSGEAREDVGGGTPSWDSNKPRYEKKTALLVTRDGRRTRGNRRRSEVCKRAGRPHGKSNIDTKKVRTVTRRGIRIGGASTKTQPLSGVA